MCAILLVATASPVARLMYWRRSVWASLQPARIAARTPNDASALVADRQHDIGASLRQIEHMARELAGRNLGDEPRHGGCDLGLAQEEQVGVVRRQRGVERSLDH